LQALLEKTEREFDTRKLYVEIECIEGIEPAAFWEDIKTYFRHFKDLDKVAFLGPDSFIMSLAKLSQPFHFRGGKSFQGRRTDGSKGMDNGLIAIGCF
jgi:hypothetical protein